MHYRAYLLDEHRHVISAANLYCADEQAAKERAQQLVGANDVELWQLDRRIAVFKSHLAEVCSHSEKPGPLCSSDLHKGPA
jgi:hypothetical protein